MAKFAHSLVSLHHAMAVFVDVDDFVIATGKSVKLKDLAKKIFLKYDLNSEKYIRTDKKLFRKHEILNFGLRRTFKNYGIARKKIGVCVCCGSWKFLKI